jgi:indole-3-glycerol phosphate synthase
MLEEILQSVRRRLPAVVEREGEYRVAAAGRPPARDFVAALQAPGLQVIAEIKRRSPSAGEIVPGLDAAEQARRYAAGGAAAISVLTEPEFFDGSLDDLAAARSAVDVPLLRKDFMLQPAQIWESRAAGADAVLLIVSALGPDRLHAMLGEAAQAGLAALVEAHTRTEAESALAAGAAVIGINNRDLATFVTDLAVAERLGGLLGGAAVRVAESGVSSSEGATRMAAAGYDAILVGEAAARADDPAVFIASLRGAAP